MVVVLIVAVLAAAIAWFYATGRNPLIYLVPIALAFPPLVTYGAMALGWPGGWLSTRVALIACLGLFGTFRILRRDLSYSRVPGLWFVIPYLLLVTASVIWSALGQFNDQVWTIGSEFLSWVIPVVVLLVLAGSKLDDDDVKRGARVLVCVAVVVAIYSGFQALALVGNERFVPEPIVSLTRYGRSDLWFGAFRLYGTLPNLGPNFLGAFLLFPAILAFDRIFVARGIGRYSWSLATIAIVSTIIGTYSRGALFALVIAMMLVPVWRRSTRGFVAMLVTTGIAIAFLAQTPLGEYARSLYAGGRFDVSGSSRLLLWSEIASETPGRPVGLGFNGWPRESRTSVNVGLLDPPATIGQPHAAENQWIRELADRGLLGVLLLGLLMGGFIRATYRVVGSPGCEEHSRSFLIAAGAAGVGWACVFLTGDHLMYENVAGMFWYMIALSLAAMRRCDSGGAEFHRPQTDRIAAPL